MSSDAKPWVALSERYGGLGESGAWKQVQEDYYWDRLDEAYQLSSSLGTGSNGVGMTLYRLIEAEWMTRQRSKTFAANDWLSIELVPDEIFLAESVIQDTIVDACDEVARRFEWEHGPQTMVTLLSLNANAPWAPGRHGFCMDKYPFDKVCVPSGLTQDMDQLREVVMHEYAHVMTMNRSNGLCPLWLDEAVAMIAGSHFDPQARWQFQVGHWPWRDPLSLSGAFGGDRESEQGRRMVWQAYQQSALLGKYLVSLKGEAGLGQLMVAYTNNPWIVNLMIRLKGEEPSEEALNEVYGFGVSELFERTYEWLLSEESDGYA